MASSNENRKQNAHHARIQFKIAVRHIRSVFLFKSVNMLTLSRVAALAILYLHYITAFINASNVGVAITVAIVFQQLELGYSLVSTTIPTLKTFIRDFDTGMGLDLASSMSNYGRGTNRYGNISHSFNGNSGSYELKERSKDGPRPSLTERLGGKVSQNFRPDLVENTTSIVHATHHRRSASAERSHTTENSQEMLIHHDVDFHVLYNL